MNVSGGRLTRLRSLRAEIEKFKAMPAAAFEGPEFEAWRMSVESHIREVFGAEHRYFAGFRNITFWARVDRTEANLRSRSPWGDASGRF